MWPNAGAGSQNHTPGHLHVKFSGIVMCQMWAPQTVDASLYQLAEEREGHADVLKALFVAWFEAIRKPRHAGDVQRTRHPGCIHVNSSLNHVSGVRYDLLIPSSCSWLGIVYY